MTSRSTRIWLACTAVLIVLVNTLATTMHWYFFIWWLDMPMHFLGGIFVGLILITLGYPVYRKLYNQNQSVGIVLIGVSILLVGFGWEIFELTAQTLSGVQFVTPLDSLSDLFFDLAGGLSALVLFAKSESTRV